MTTQEQLDYAIVSHALAVLVRRAGGFVKITQAEIDALDGGCSMVMDFESQTISLTAQQEKSPEGPELSVKS
jgi:hypothetical protein